MSTNPFQLYDQLMQLTLTGDAFFFKDFPADDPERMYRIFNYRLASYSDFCKPGALECRGTMFLVDRKGNFDDLVCRPPKKFFNLGENPFTENLDLTNLGMVMRKEDGSLMSTYLHTNGELRLKSKGSTGSTQANDAMAYLKTQPALLADLRFLASRDFTVNLEWCAPWNRIVVGYQQPTLIGLSIIDMQTGTVYDGESMIDDLGLAGLSEFWVEQYQYSGDLLDAIEKMTGDEGVVAMTSKGVFFKLKCPWYLALHRNKDNVSNTRALIELILSEQIDDLKVLFTDDQAVLDKINAYEKSISSVYNHTCSVVESFHDRHHALDRKEYAIAAKAEYTDWVFNVQMSRYIGSEWEHQIKFLMQKNYSNYILKEFEGTSSE
jgi:T4 RnlA family RNA ligase